jgi:hypothetical protein
LQAGSAAPPRCEIVHEFCLKFGDEASVLGDLDAVCGIWAMLEPLECFDREKQIVAQSPEPLVAERGKSDRILAPRKP